MESEGYQELKDEIGIGYVRHGLRKKKIPNVDGAFDSSKSEERALSLVMKLGRNVIKEKIGKQTAGTARKRKIAKERRRKRQKKY